MKYFYLFLIVSSSVLCYAQKPNPYGLEIIDSRAAYRKSVALDSNNRLVEIKRYIRNIRLDIRYATKNNFTGQAVYDQPQAFARLAVVRALQKVQAELNRSGLGLKIYDAYRPYAVTVKFFKIASNKDFVANPKNGSRHNRGCAVDVTLINQKTGKELVMPTPYDSFEPEASPDFADLPEQVKKNRDLLRRTMEKYGFTVIENEWWHFDYKGWQKYDLMDIPFKQL